MGDYGWRLMHISGVCAPCFLVETSLAAPSEWVAAKTRPALQQIQVGPLKRPLIGVTHSEESVRAE